MIKLFRRFRRRLIEQDNMGRYLKYAIGEILLVVIGILIALQINNWNESRKEADRERILLNNLKVEFEDNLKQLDSISLEIDNVVNSLEKVFKLFENPESLSVRDSLDFHLNKGLNLPSWRPSEYLLNNLNNSNEFANLKNNDLKLLLYQWYRLDNKTQVVDARSEVTGRELVSFLKNNGSLRNIDVLNESFNYSKSILMSSNSFLLSNPKFENYIGDKLYMYRLKSSLLKEARELLNKLIEEIKY